MSRFSPTLLDHFRNPRNAGKMDNPDAIAESRLSGGGPCVRLRLRIDDGVITQASFLAFGCGVTIAACSALTKLIQNCTVDSCLSLRGDDVVDALDGIPPDKRFCADIVMDALRDALLKRVTNE